MRVPALGVFETITNRDALITNTLAVDAFELTENNIKLYPNPTEDMLHLKLPDGISISSLKIMDVNGRIVLTSNSNSSSLNVSQLQAGFYVLNIATEKGKIIKKFVKK